MKKHLCIVLVAVFVLLSLTSCLYNTANKPEKVTLEGMDFKKAFVNELYPYLIGFTDNTVPVKTLSGHYYRYKYTVYDCYINYDSNAYPNVYFASDEFDEAVSYYTNKDNFKYYCLIGNEYDVKNHQLTEIQNADPEAFEQLRKFCAEYRYNPFTSFNNQEGIKTVPLVSEDWTADEIFFYKKSKDGLFQTQKYALVLYENKLHLLYQYHLYEENPQMLIRELPQDLNNYFSTLLNTTKE